MLYILTLQILAMFSTKFVVLSRFFALFLGANSRLFLDLDRYNSNLQIFQVSLGTLSHIITAFCTISCSVTKMNKKNYEYLETTYGHNLHPRA